MSNECNRGDGHGLSRRRSIGRHEVRLPVMPQRCNENSRPVLQGYRGQGSQRLRCAGENFRTASQRRFGEMGADHHATIPTGQRSGDKGAGGLDFESEVSRHAVGTEPKHRTVSEKEKMNPPFDLARLRWWATCAGGGKGTITRRSRQEPRLTVRAPKMALRRPNSRPPGFHQR